jgi:hypothetical protein
MNFSREGLQEGGKKCSSELGLGNCALTFILTAQHTKKICVGRIETAPGAYNEREVL